MIVNPPSRERIRAIAEAGGPPKALSWVVDGMKTKTVEEVPATREALKRQLEAQGLPSDVIDKMLDVAGSASESFQSDDIMLPPDQREDAEAQAVTIALATMESRIRIDDLVAATDPSSDLGLLYRVQYAHALGSAGLYAVDLIERFPVLTGHFGYTRGDHEPGKGRLVPYKGRHGQGYKVYADIAETEALFVRLDPIRVAKWLTDEGHSLPEWHDERTARLAILETVCLPSSTDEKDESVGAALLELVHSYAHRFLRIAAFHAGIDRNALSELLVPCIWVSSSMPQRGVTSCWEGSKLCSRLNSTVYLMPSCMTSIVVHWIQVAKMPGQLAWHVFMSENHLADISIAI